MKKTTKIMTVFILVIGLMACSSNRKEELINAKNLAKEVNEVVNDMPNVFSEFKEKVISNSEKPEEKEEVKEENLEQPVKEETPIATPSTPTPQPKPEQPQKPIVPEYTPKQEGYDTEYAMEVFNLINQERAKRGVPVLPWDNELATEISNVRAPQLVNDYSHQGLFDMLGIGCEWRDGRVSECCTNYGSGSSIAVNGLLNSKGHYDAIMDTHTTNKTMAVATYYANGRYFTVINFTY